MVQNSRTYVPLALLQWNQSPECQCPGSLTVTGALLLVGLGSLLTLLVIAFCVAIYDGYLRMPRLLMGREGGRYCAIDDLRVGSGGWNAGIALEDGCHKHGRWFVRGTSWLLF